RYVTNSKGELVVIARSGEIVIHDEHGRERKRHKVPYGAILAVKADQQIKVDPKRSAKVIRPQVKLIDVAGNEVKIPGTDHSVTIGFPVGSLIQVRDG